MSTRLQLSLPRLSLPLSRRSGGTPVCLPEPAGRAKSPCDIGCHKGAYTYWMRRRVGPSGAVYAFEPQPKQVAYLREAFSAMRYDNVELVPMAVSNKCGEMPLYASPVEGRTHVASLEVAVGAASRAAPRRPRLCRPIWSTVTTLDDFFAGRPHGPQLSQNRCRGARVVGVEGGHEARSKSTDRRF